MGISLLEQGGDLSPLAVIHRWENNPLLMNPATLIIIYLVALESLSDISRAIRGQGRRGLNRVAIHSMMANLGEGHA